MNSFSKQSSQAILLVAFGSSLPHTQTIYQRVVAIAQARFPTCDIFIAYSSRMVLARLEREGRPAPGVRAVAEHIVSTGYRELHVLPLFAIAGEDFGKWSSQLQDLAPCFSRYSIGKPLLHNTARVQQVCQLLLQTYNDRAPNELLILMGHGSPHAEGQKFEEMAQTLHHLDAHTYFGSVEGNPPLEQLLADLAQQPLHKILLAPFMMVTGDHAMNDMAGDDDDSWKSQLTRQGYTVRTRQLALLEIPAIVDLLLEEMP